MSYPHGGLRTGRLGPPSTVQVDHPLRCGLVDAGAQVGPLVLRRGLSGPPSLCLSGLPLTPSQPVRLFSSLE